MLFEATCNQVNQDGGYTGMTPADFVAFVHAIADRVDFDHTGIALGGDHLGPNPWTSLDADAAMDKAEVMVEAYVAAGFRKIHLDCSMACRGDAEPLPEAEIVRRAVRLCQAAEAVHAQAGGEAPVYVIGTEVPVPAAPPKPSTASPSPRRAAAKATIEAHRQAFVAAGLERAWQRVIASVVQPGVEFDHHSVIDYQPDKAARLERGHHRRAGHGVRGALDRLPDTRRTERAGPRSFRHPQGRARPHLRAARSVVGTGCDRARMDRGIAPGRPARGGAGSACARQPGYWQRYYHSRDHALTIDLQYSLSDRIRYYWPDPAIEQARQRLFDNLRANPPPMPLISQFMPHALHALRTGNATADPLSLTIAHISATLDDYDHACNDHDVH